MKWWLLSVVLLSGCVTTYAPPANKSQPAVRVDMKRIDRLMFYEEGKDCSQATSIKAPYNPYLPDAKPLPVRANKLLAFQLFYSRNRQACDAIVSFYPRLNHDYVIYNKVKYDPRNTLRCSFKVIRKNRLAKAARWEDEETVRFRKPVKSIKADERHCR